MPAIRLPAIRQLASAALFAIAAPAAAQDVPATPAGREALEILKEAIAVPTVEGRGQVPALAAKVTGRLLAAGFAARDVLFVRVGETGYLTARIPGRDTAAKPILVVGHLDVVEAKMADWTRDPFVPVVADGYVYGRGAYDNKGDVAMLLAAAFKLKREGWRPARDVILAFTGDEETGMASTAVLAEAFKGAELVLNIDGGVGHLDAAGQPAVYTLQAGEKTYADYELTVTDPGGHSSRPGGTNAIAVMSAALGRIAAYRFTPEQSALTRAFWQASAPRAEPEMAAAMRAFLADPADAQAADRLSTRPDYVGLVRTTCVPTLVHGGHARNALPQSVTANVNCRILPGTTRAATGARLAQVIGDARVAIVQLESGTLEAPESPLRPDVMRAVERAVHARARGVPIVPGISPGATDSMHFRARGVPAFGVSAVFIRPEDDLSHGLDERLPLATIDPGVQQYEVLLRAIAR